MFLVQAAKLIGAGIAVSCFSGAGVGIGAVFGALINALARHPGLTHQLFSYAILGFALTEAIALFGLMMSFLILFSVVSNLDLPCSECMYLNLPTVMPVGIKKPSAGALMSAAPNNFIEWVRFFNGLYGYDVDGSKLSAEQVAVKYFFYLSFSKYVREPFSLQGPGTKPQIITLAEPELDHQRLLLFGVELFYLAQKNTKLLLLWKHKQTHGALTLTQSFDLLLNSSLSNLTQPLVDYSGPFDGHTYQSFTKTFLDPALKDYITLSASSLSDQQLYLYFGKVFGVSFGPYSYQQYQTKLNVTNRYLNLHLLIELYKGQTLSGGDGVLYQDLLAFKVKLLSFAELHTITQAYPTYVWKNYESSWASLPVAHWHLTYFQNLLRDNTDSNLNLLALDAELMLMRQDPFFQV